MNTKVILNKDLATLGEEGDVKHVTRGYARNFLFPRGIAVPFNERTQKMFEARKDEIEARKVEKRKDAASLKEKLEALELTVVMPAGSNGKLYGAVTSQTAADELLKNGFSVDRKKIDIPGNTIKSAGKYKLAVRLYDNTSAEVSITVEAQQTKAEEKPAPFKKRRFHDGAVPAEDEASQTEGADGGAAVAESGTGEGEGADPAASDTAPADTGD
jgi:large subunit ribosomal protein L9